MQLKLSFLGRFAAFLDGVALNHFESTKVRGLLAFLAIEAGRAHSRDALCGLFWPDWPQPSARRNLSQALFNLRQVIGDGTATPPFLLSDRLQVQWNQAANGIVDVWLVEQILQQPAARLANQQLEALVDLYSGKLLDGFVLDDGDLFMQWLENRREGLQRKAMQAFDEQIERWIGTGQPNAAAALPLVERQLQLEPWREESHRHMMRLLAGMGQRSAALGQFERCKKLLATELGVEPDPQTVQLVAKIQQGDFDLPSSLTIQALSPQNGNSALPTIEAPEQDWLAPEPSQRQPALLPPVSNLPPVSANFIGRATELSEVVRLFEEEACHLLTLIGPGGIGKTWLSICAAHRMAQRFADGVCFVSLAEAEANWTESVLDQVVQPIANTLALTFSTQSPPLEQLATYLADKHLLLVIDNFEPLIEGAFVLSELLAAAPHLRILATSRERLNLPEEWLLELEGLGFPDENVVSEESRNPQTLMVRYPALELFVQSARRVQSNFRPTSENIAAIVRICQLVAGMPLGIAIAASWVRHLTCAEIVGEMERDRDFLTSAQRNLPTRHRSMRAIFDYSWRLLSNDEQRSLSSLSLFPQSFERTAATAVSATSLRLLANLVDKSLLRRLENGRYIMHPQLRHFAHEHLEQTPTLLDQVRQRHAQYFADFLHHALAGLSGQDQQQALTRTDLEADNIRLGWRYAVEYHQTGLLDRYVPGIFHFYNIRGWYLEGATLFQTAIHHLRSLPQGIKAETELCQVMGALLVHCAEFLHRLSSFDAAYALLEEALPLVRSHQRSGEIGFALNALGYNFYMRGHYAQALPPYQQALALFRQSEQASGVATVLNNLGNLWAAQEESDNYEAAQRCYVESLQIARSSGNQQEAARALLNLGSIAHVQKEYVSARYYYEESLNAARLIDSRRVMAIALTNLGDIDIQLNQLDAAQRNLSEALVLKRKVGDQRSTAYALNVLSDVYFKLGDKERARLSCIEAARTGLAVNAIPAAMEALLQLAMLLVDAQQLRPAAQLAVIIQQHPAAEGYSKKQAHDLLAQLPDRLTEEEIRLLQRLVQTDQLKSLLEPILQTFV